MGDGDYRAFGLLRRSAVTGRYVSAPRQVHPSVEQPQSPEREKLEYSWGSPLQDVPADPLGLLDREMEEWLSLEPGVSVAVRSRSQAKVDDSWHVAFHGGSEIELRPVGSSTWRVAVFPVGHDGAVRLTIRFRSGAVLAVDVNVEEGLDVQADVTHSATDVPEAIRIDQR